MKLTAPTFLIMLVLFVGLFLQPVAAHATAEETSAVPAPVDATVPPAPQTPPGPGAPVSKPVAPPVTTAILPPLPEGQPWNRGPSKKHKGKSKKREVMIPGFNLICVKSKGKGGGLLRCGPGLDKAMTCLQGRRCEEAVQVLKGTVTELDRAKATYHGLKEGKQAAATRHALTVGEHDSHSTAFMDSVSAAKRQHSPIVLDLNGNGKADVTTPDVTGENGAFVAKGSVYFDIQGAGRSRRTEWLLPHQDGLLFVDINGNGLADSAGELFGDSGAFSDGYARMELLDSNRDHRLSGPELGHLRVWIDGGDGVCQPEEVKTLEGLKITSLDTRHEDLVASFIRDGKSYKTWDWFPRGE